MKYFEKSDIKSNILEYKEEIINEDEKEDEFVSDYINNNIKNIEDVEIHLEKMSNEIIELDKVINEKVENHILRKNEYESKLKNIKEKIKLINSKMEDVDKKTEESEDILIKLCKDIKKLDIGKKNVTETIIILKRIVMVITAISNLKKKALKRDYKDCISLVSVIKEMLIHILDLKTNDKLNDLYNDANTLFNDLKNQIKEDIDLIYDCDVHIEKNVVVINEINDNKIYINLFDACNCLYYLNSNFITNIVKKFTNFFLEKYILIFENQANTLESIDRRIAWLKRSLNNYENTYSHIFPNVYNVPFNIVSKFCSITKKHIVKIISSSIEEINPVLLIQTVIKVIKFENFLTKNIKLYGPDNHVSYDNCYSSLEFPFPELIIQKDMKHSENDQLLNNNLKENINDYKNINNKNETSSTENMKNDTYFISKKNSYNKEENVSNKCKGITNFKEFNCVTVDDDKKSSNDIKSDINDNNNNNNNNKCEENYSNKKNKNIDFIDISSPNKERNHNFKGAISCVFDSYLCNWLKYEEKKILIKFENIINENEEDNVDNLRINKTKQQNFVNDTFDDVKNLLNKNEFMPEMDFEIIEKHTVYKSAYKIFYLYKSYVNMILLFSNCQTLFDFIMFFKTLLFKYGDELNKRIIIKIKEENKIQNFKLLSILINTSYYVEQTINEAYENIINDIDSIFCDKISFKEEEKIFLNIKTKCIKVIITYMEEKLNTILYNNCVVNIYDINKIQEKSHYISNIEVFLHNYFTLFKKIFNETYLTYLLEKTTTLIIQRFYQIIFSFKYMTNITAQQLLLDCYEIQKVLFQIPNILNNENKENNYVENNTEDKKEEKNKKEFYLTKKENLTDVDEFIIPKTYFNYIKNQMNKIEFLIKIFLSNVYDMDSFNLLLTENNNICTMEEIEKILSLKEKKNESMENNFNLNKNYMYDIKKRGIKAAEEVKFFFNKITSI
ncbi:vacuolar protein sorting-associated protein 53, putative [Plasmodium gallinaceum]|uniref:Vacuolar protein sorting-associated protein 53, putative n=1 Tax=Plasmodium gallinaceum TaxID=5849 RepID=A0A1J1GLM0_PLAGA|nr:vacuolar protein sorting-associated protein 53, putative [Plasmodium gallinaceum]CRG93273.1 vacuolar protein sorting-associated protein 53, putative [Plasmodium gallinaceum]